MRVRGDRRFLAACAFLVATALLGGETPPKPIPGVEQVTVRLAQFDVVVRDSSGRTVRGLLPSDFKVVEDGAPLEVVAVDEWGAAPPVTGHEEPAATATAAPAPPPAAVSPAPGSARPQPAPAEPQRRSFVFVFDALGESTALRMSQSKRAAEEFIRSRFRRGDDLGAVYQLDLTLRSLSPVSSDPEALVRGIEKIAWMPPSSLADQIDESVIAYANQANHNYAQQRLTEMAASANSELEWKREHVYESLDDLSGVFESMPGKRVLVLASPGFPMTTSADLRFQNGGFTPKFAKLIRSLARVGATVYSIDIGSELTAGDASQAIDWRVAAGKIGLDENLLGDLGLDRTLGANSAMNRRQFLGVIAAESGGRMLTDTDLNRSFAAIDDETNHFYRISCRVSLGSSSTYRSLKVSVVRPGYTVTSRRGRYSDVTPLERLPSGGTAPRAVDSLAGYKKLAATGVAAPLPAGALPKIPVSVVLEVAGPVDVPAGANGSAKLDLDVLIVARAADEVVARYTHGFTASLKRGVDAVRGGFRVEGRLDLVPGIYDVQGTVRLAAPAQIATWSGTVAVAPQSKSSAPAVLGPLVTVDGEASPLLSRVEIPAEGDPLAVKPGVRILPTAGTDFPLGRPLLVLFWLSNFAAADAAEIPSLDIAARLTDAAGAPAKTGSELLYFGRASTGGLCGIVRLDTAGLGAGTYLVEVRATPPSAAAPIVRHSAPFDLRAPDAGAVPARAATSSSVP